MVTVQKLSTGSKNSITSIASGNNSCSMLNANIETTADGSGVVLKVRKPYIISKQREKWTEDEHHKFIEALKLYGRAWRQIEEYIGTKTAVQIRSHAQKIFTKVMKKGSSNTGASNEPIEIPPPRPKRKTLHPYPRKFLVAPNETRTCSSLLEKGTSANLKTMERDSHSPTSVVAPEGSEISTSHAKDLGSGSASPTSSGSNLSHVVESSLIKDNLTVGKEIENEGNFLLTLNLGGPSPDELTFMKTAKELKNIELSKNEDAFLKSQIKFAPLKTIKLFGHTVVVASPLEYSDGTNKALVHAATRNLLISTDSHIDPLVFKWSQTHASIPKLALNIDGQLVLEDMGMGERSREKEGSKGISYTGSTSNAFHKPGNGETPNFCREGFVPCKKFVSDREAVSMMNAVEDKESWRIQVCL